MTAMVLAAQGTDSFALSRIVQSAAILLELGGALLVAMLFAIVGRMSPRREYFATWTAGWYAMVVALGAIAVRYVVLINATGGLLPETAWSVRIAYLVYQTGKVLFWAFVCRGALVLAGQARGGLSTWIAAALGYAWVSLFLSDDLNRVLVWQAPVAIVGCAVGATVLLRLRATMSAAGRSVGLGVTGIVLFASTLLWSVYFVVFSPLRPALARMMPSITGFIVSYNSYMDMLMLVTLGYAMLMVFLEGARRRLSDIEARVASLVRSSPESIIALDNARRVVVANAATGRLFGAEAHVSRGAAIDDFVAPAERLRLREAIDAFTASDEASRLVGPDGCMSAVRADGTRFTGEFTLSRLFDADVRGVSVIVRDVSVKREEEERRRQATTMEAVRQLAGGLAHDFNNLLTTIVGRSQVVGRTLPPGSPVRDDLTQIELAAASAARLSRSLLALSRRQQLDPERLEPDTVVRGMESRVRGIAGPGVTTMVNLGADRARAHVDRSRLESAIMAIVQNAFDAAAGCGDVVIETSRAFWPRHFGANTEAVCIAVRDTGHGFTADAREHLFEPFFSTKGDGRGLGLATTWAFMHQSGGTVDVESGSNSTTVRLLFPLAAEIVVPAGDALSPTLSIVQNTPPLSRTVLVAEDEESVRKSVRIFLEKAGFTVVTAADGIEALAAFERSPDKFGLLLTDVMMPQMGGRELATELMRRRPELRVVFMSGLLRDPEVLQMVNDRRVRFIAKPFDIDTLISTVRGEFEEADTHAA